MNLKHEWKPLFWLIIGFLFCFYLPVGNSRFDNSIFEGLYLVKWYAQEHVLLCLIPAFFIAGAISVFISKDAVIRYLGDSSNKFLSYGIASISGTILAVCSCTILPIFAGIYKRGAGLGPAIAFLYSGPAINVLAIIMTARILGFDFGIARAFGAIIFSIIIGLIMAFIFRFKDTQNKVSKVLTTSEVTKPLWQVIIYFAVMIGILVFANWAKPDINSGLWFFIYSTKWVITGILGLLLALILIFWFNLSWYKVLLVTLFTVVSILIYHNPLISFTIAIIGLSIILIMSEGENKEWFTATWEFTKQITPLLLIGVFIAGVLLGRPGNEGLIPSNWIVNSVGSNSILSNLLSSVVGAFMYFATLTEIPILQGLIGSGMHKGPALALLLAGPALSLPNMLVINSIMGIRKTFVYVFLVIIMATITGLIYGSI